MSYMTVRIDRYDAIDMLVDRVKHWTDDREVIDLFEEYYSSAVASGCFDGCEFDVMCIVDNDYVNNMTITTREEFEKDRKDYIEEQLKSDGFNKEDEDFDIDEYNEALEQYENEVPQWEDLERGENTLDFLSGSYIEAITSNCLLMS